MNHDARPGEAPSLTVTFGEAPSLTVTATFGEAPSLTVTFCEARVR
jgi:hypothetical protein